MLLKRPAFLRALEQPDPSVRLWMVFGPDAGEAGALVTAARAALLTAGGEVLSLASSALEADPGRLADEAASVPMFGSGRLILAEGLTERAAEAVRLLLAAPAAGNPVLVASGDLAPTSALRRSVEAHPCARTVIAWTPSEREGAEQAETLALSQGLRLEQGDAEALWRACGGHAGILAREVEKLAIAAGATPEAPQHLSRTLFASLVADSEGEDVSRLVAAILAGDRKALPRALALADGPFPALRALVRRLVLLLALRATMAEQSLSAAAAVREHRPPIFFRERDLIAQVLPAWPVERIAAALAMLLAAERAIKSPRGAGEVMARQALLLAASRKPLGDPARAA